MLPRKPMNISYHTYVVFPPGTPYTHNLTALADPCSNIHESQHLRLKPACTRRVPRVRHTPTKNLETSSELRRPVLPTKHLRNRQCIMCPLSPYSTPSSNIESPANRQTSKKTRARYSTKMSRDENNLLIFGYYLLMFTNNKTHPQKNNYMYIIYINI